MNYYIIVYFLVGLLQDFIIALYTRLINKGAAISSAVLSTLITIINLAVIYSILARFDSEKSILAILAYALGNGVGTFIGTKFKIGFLMKK